MNLWDIVQHILYNVPVYCASCGTTLKATYLTKFNTFTGKKYQILSKLRCNKCKEVAWDHAWATM